MRYVVSAAWLLACLVLMAGIGRTVSPMIGMALAGEIQVASVEESAVVPSAKGALVRAPHHDMTPLPKTAQMRCPGGTLLFLSNSCGCNGACCACSLQARFLNHCTCQCQQAPPPPGSCRVGFSVGSQ